MIRPTSRFRRHILDIGYIMVDHLLLHSLLCGQSSLADSLGGCPSGCLLDRLHRWSWCFGICRLGPEWSALSWFYNSISTGV